MSWTDDVAAELRGLDLSVRGLRRFAFGVGAVLVAIAAWAVLRRHAAPAGWAGALGAVGLLLAALGAAAPALLRPVYRAWMALAFALGWVMSRVVLTALFFLAVTPVALAARLGRKRFLELDADPAAGTYWIRRPPGRPGRYEKMY